jgi:sugar lactone lactonase YvrE
MRCLCSLHVLFAAFAVASSSFAEPVIEVFAGNGTTEFAGEGVLAVETGLTAPMSLAVDGEGRVVFSDAEQGRVLRIEADGTLTTLAGTGFLGFSGDGGPAKEAFLSRPGGLSLDTEGQVYIADRMNHRIRKIGSEGTIETLAGDGSGMFGLGTYSGDGLPALQTALNFPSATLLEPEGSLLIADQMNGRVRKVDPDGTIATLLGGDKRPQMDLKEPADLACDASGGLLVVDARGDRIWAASGENDFELLLGPRPHPSVNPRYPHISVDRPVAVAVAADGSLLWAETGNNRVSRLSPSGKVDVLMSGPRPSSRGASGASDPRKPSLGVPADLLCLSDGTLLVADSAGHRIWKISNLD